MSNALTVYSAGVAPFSPEKEAWLEEQKVRKICDLCLENQISVSCGNTVKKSDLSEISVQTVFSTFFGFFYRTPFNKAFTNTLMYSLSVRLYHKYINSPVFLFQLLQSLLHKNKLPCM